MEHRKNSNVTPPTRFQVLSVGCENGAFEPDEKLTYPPVGRTGPQSRLSVPDFLSSVVPGRRRTSSLNVQENADGSGVTRKTSRANSIFSEMFASSDCHLVDYNSEAAPRLESYRNSLTAHGCVTRPTLDALHGARQADCRPVLTTGKGENKGAVKFGWIKGVYIRCLLNIWGVMLFLRMGWMTGQCGIILSIVIVLLSTVVTVITTLSMSAICTNGDVKGGGAYYMISRSLGPEFGGVVGILLFLANAVSGAMYIIGAGEAIRDILNEVGAGIVEFPSGVNDIRVSGIVCLLLTMSVTGIGMAFENKTQMVLLVILLVAMLDYFVGACFPPTDDQKAQGFMGWSQAVGVANLGPDFRGETFFSVFAVFFPSVTGILAGANISGDLKDPCSAIPRGTLLSIATTSLSYIALILWLGFTMVRDASGDLSGLVNETFPNCTLEQHCAHGLQNNYQVMKMSSAFGPLIYAGIFAATLSSALVSIVSAPRILQALCVDGIIPWLNWFGKGYGKDNDPRRALALTFVIAVVFTAIGDLNAVAPIISNFFMAANGLINFSCFHASYVKSPGFRPGFRYYNLWLSLLGALLCVVIMFVMNWITALVTDVVVVALYIYIAKTCPEINWGSSFQGYSYRNALYYLNKLTRVEEHVKNYRPAILVLSGNASSRPQLVDFAGHLTKDIGLQICAHISKDRLDWQRRCLLQELNSRWLAERRVKAFYALVEADSFENGVAALIQTAGVGKMRPNVLLMGFKDDWQSCDTKETLDYFHAIHQAVDAHLSLCILRIPGGADCSAHSETPDGLPILQSFHPSAPKAPELKVTLETVLEETPPPYRIVSAEEARTDPKMTDLFHDKQPKGDIDVWWLYDDGGLTVLLPYLLTTRAEFKGCRLRVFSVAQDNTEISDEQRNLAALLQKFRIPFTDLTVISAEGAPLHAQSTETFKKMISKFLSKDESAKDPGTVTRSTLNALKNRTNQFLRLRELLEKHSKSSNLIVMLTNQAGFENRRGRNGGGREGFARRGGIREDPGAREAERRLQVAGHRVPGAGGGGAARAQAEEDPPEAGAGEELLPAIPGRRRQQVLPDLPGPDGGRVSEKRRAGHPDRRGGREGRGLGPRGLRGLHDERAGRAVDRGGARGRRQVAPPHGPRGPQEGPGPPAGQRARAVRRRGRPAQRGVGQRERRQSGAGDRLLLPGPGAEAGRAGVRRVPLPDGQPDPAEGPDPAVQAEAGQSARVAGGLAPRQQPRQIRPVTHGRIV